MSNLGPVLDIFQISVVCKCCLKCFKNTRWTQMIWVIQNIYLRKTKRHTEMKLMPLEEVLQHFIACRSDVITMNTSRTFVYMIIKWWLNLRKCFVCSSSIQQNLWLLFDGVFGGSSIKILHVQLHFTLSVESPSYCRVNICTPGNHC
jgi:hypothetical protein